MCEYESHTIDLRQADRSIREALLALISAAIHSRGLTIENIRQVDPRVTRPQWQGLRDAQDGMLSKERLYAIADGLEVGHAAEDTFLACAA
jgi:hypothetical protein